MPTIDTHQSLRLRLCRSLIDLNNKRVALVQKEEKSYSDERLLMQLSSFIACEPLLQDPLAQPLGQLLDPQPHIATSVSENFLKYRVELFEGVLDYWHGYRQRIPYWSDDTDTFLF